MRMNDSELLKNNHIVKTGPSGRAATEPILV